MPQVAQPSQSGAVEGGSTGHARSRASEVFGPPVQQRVSGPAFEGHHVRKLIGHGSARPPVLITFWRVSLARTPGVMHQGLTT